MKLKQYLFRMLALLIVVLIFTSSIPVTVLANNTNMTANKSVTRAEFITLIDKIFNSAQIINTKDSISNSNNKTSKSNNFVTREEAITTVVKIIKLPPITKNMVKRYRDALRVSIWAKEAINTALYYGLIRGYSDNTIRPKNFITKAEAIVLLNRALDLQKLYNKVTKISIKTMPSKTIYTEGELLDLTGLVVTLIYSNGTTEDILFKDFATKGIVTNPSNGTILSTADKQVTITHTNSSRNTSFLITVHPIPKVKNDKSTNFVPKVENNTNITTSIVFNSVPVVKTVTGIIIKTAPAKTVYTEGEQLDLRGLVLILMYSDGTTEDIPFENFVAKGIITNPANGTTLTTTNKEVSITHMGSGKSISLLITVKETNKNAVENEKDFYKLIKNALENNLETVYVGNVDPNNPMYDKIIKLVIYQHPELGCYINSELCYINSNPPYQWYYDGKEYYIKFNYIYPLNEVKVMKDLVNNKAREIISKIIKPGMTDLEKVKAIHDYIVLNSKYDYQNYLNNTIPPVSRNIYGIIVNKIGVCTGYAGAFNLLANMAGIESLGVYGRITGSTETHIWNMIRIDGKVSYIDVTWDDTVPDIEGYVRYEYFNVSEEQMSKNHIWNKDDFAEKYFDYNK